MNKKEETQLQLTELIKELRRTTSLGIVDCKEAIQKAKDKGFIDKEKIIEEAMNILRAKGKKIQEFRKEVKAGEGIIAAYVHHNGRVGALVEIGCETDFVAHSEDFKNLAKDIAMQIVAMSPKYITREEVDKELIDKKKKEYEEELKCKESKELIEKIVEDKMLEFYKEICLVEQLFIKNEDITVSEYLLETMAKLKEKIEIKRFVRFELGEV